MILRSVLLAAAAGFLCLPPVTHAADIGVLMPAAPGLRVLTRQAQVWDSALGIASAVTSGRNSELTGWARRDRVDLPARLTQQLIASFRITGRSANLIAVTHRPGNAGLPITRDQIPEHPSATLLLDLTFDYAGLYANSDGSPFRPAFIITYRWVNSRGDLVQGSRPIVYNGELWNAYRVSLKALLVVQAPPPGMPFIEVDPDCKFESFGEAEEGAAKLWDCFDKALQKIADQIADDVPSARNLSGGMTSERPDNP